MDKDTLQNSIIDCIDLEDYDGALNHLSEYEERFEEDLFYYLSLSDVLLAMDVFEDVIDLMTEAMDHGFINSLVYERLGDAYYGLEEYDQAISYFKKCDIDEDGEDKLYILYKIALSLEEKHMYTEAIPYFEDVLLDVPNYIDALLESALCYLKINQTQRALEYLDKVLTLEPDQIYRICDELIFQDNEDVLRTYVTRLDSTEDRYNILLTFYIHHENKTKAYDCIHKLMKIDRSLVNLDCLASTYDHFGDFELATRAFEDVIRMPDDPDISLELSLLIHFDGFDFLNESSGSYKEYIRGHMTDAGNDLHIFNSILQFLNKHNDWQIASEFIEMEQPNLAGADPEEADIYYSTVFHYYLGTERYKEGLLFLNNKVPKSYPLYLKTKVILDFYLEKYDDVILEYEDVMPDGTVAFMAFASYQQLDRPYEASCLVEDFLEFSMSHPNVEDIDIFIEWMDDYIKMVEQ